MNRFTCALIALALAAATPSASAQSCLRTLNPFLANNNGNVGGALYFDLTVAAPVLIQSLDMNCNATVGTPVGVDMYTTPGTSVGNEANMAVWTLVGSDNTAALSAGRDLVTSMTLLNPVLLGIGSYGIALVARGTAHAYTNGTGLNQTYSDPFLAMNLGSALNVPFTGVPFTPRVWNGAICYTPVPGLFAFYSASPQSGGVPLAVSFTDQSYSSDPAGIQSWSWDVNGDTLVDYTTQNPTHTYTSEGYYDVTLTVTDTLNPPQSLTRSAYIAVDAVRASFTHAPPLRLTVQFTDTSSGGPTSWAWDFDSDGTVDSTQRNPTYTYPRPGAFQARLTVMDAFSNDSASTNVTPISTLSIPPFGLTSVGTSRGFWFQTPVRFSIVSLRVPDESSTGLQNVVVYNLGAAPPVLPARARSTPVFAVAGQPSERVIPCSISFAAQDYVGVLGACGSTTLQNSYGAPAGPFASSVLGQPVTLVQLLSQTNISVNLGTGQFSQDPTLAVSRAWLGISSATGLPYGTGTPSGTGQAAPVLATTAVPRLGSRAELTVTQTDVNALGVVALAIGPANLPLPLGTILIDLLNFQGNFLVGVPMNVGATSIQFQVPPFPILNGAGPLNWQNVNSVPGSPNGVSLSNGQEWFLGI